MRSSVILSCAPAATVHSPDDGLQIASHRAAKRRATGLQKSTDEAMGERVARLVHAWGILTLGEQRIIGKPANERRCIGHGEG